MTNILTACLGFFLFLTIVSWLGPVLKKHPMLSAMGVLLFFTWIGMDKVMAFVNIILKIGISVFIFAVILATVASYNKDKYVDDNEDDDIY